MLKEKMHCAEDGYSCWNGSEDDFYKGEAFYVNYPKKAEMTDITKEFSIIPENSKYTIMKGYKIGLHSEWNDEEAHYYQVKDKDEYYAVYYDEKKVDDFVAPAAAHYLDTLDVVSKTANTLKPVLDKFNVATLVMDDYLNNIRKDKLVYTVYNQYNAEVLKTIAQCCQDEHVIGNASDQLYNLYTKYKDCIVKRENNYKAQSAAVEILKLAKHTCFVPNKDKKFYENIGTATYQENMLALEVTKEKGIKKLKTNVSKLYSCVKVLSFSFVKKKMLQINHSKMSNELLKELCKDALKLNQVCCKTPLKEATLQKAIMALPEVEDFIGSNYNNKTVEKIFKQAKIEIREEISKSKPSGREE